MLCPYTATARHYKAKGCISRTIAAFSVCVRVPVCFRHWLLWVLGGGPQPFIAVVAFNLFV